VPGPDANAAAAMDEAAADEQDEESQDAMHGGDEDGMASMAQAAMLSQVLQQRPEILEEIIGQLAQHNPQLLQTLGQNREALMAMLQNPQVYGTR
jgi:hypothetical protein